MPSPADFRRSFGLEQGQDLGKSLEWRIASLRVGHVVKEQNNYYEFPTELTLHWQPDTSARGSKQQAARRRMLEGAWREATRAKPVVYSPYGSPYACAYGAASGVSPLDEEGRSWQLHSLGRAARRRDIPTLGQQAEEERREQGAREVTKEEERSHLQGYRVIRSRFGSSKCGACGGAIKQGIKICKKEGDARKGGWVHATCILQQKRGAVGDQTGEDGGGRGEEGYGNDREGEEAGASKVAERQPPGRSKGAAAIGQRRSKRRAHGSGQERLAGGGSSQKTADPGATSGGKQGAARRSSKRRRHD